MTLGEYLLEAGRTPWGWGAKHGIDCCKFAAGWVMLRGHPDPMAFLQPLYDSEIAALRTIQHGGGLVALWTRGMEDAGVPQTDFRNLGTVGVLALETEDGLNEALGIWTGERWATRGIAGMEFGPAVPLLMWQP